MKKKDPAKKTALKTPLTRIAAVPTFYRAWCDTQSIWISRDWTTMDQANADAQTHIDMGHVVEIKQKIG